MKIKNIKINNYGNLENKEINLENKINIIYGKNESGKSTLLNYIKNIFYGISKNKNGKEISDYEKFKPWMKEEFSGKIKYELNNGENFEIFRDFNKKNPKVFNGNLEEISKEFNIDKKDGSQFFYEQTKVDEMMFLSTIVSMQQEVRLDRQSQQILVQKLANLAGTGDDNISFKKVLDKLSKRQVDEVGTERTQGKPINLVKDRMKNIEFVIKDIKKYKNNKEEIEVKKEKLKEKNHNLEIKNNIIKKLNKINSEIILEKEKIKLKNKIKNEKIEKIKELNLEKNKLEENKKEINLKNNKFNKLNNNYENNLEKNNYLNNKKNKSNNNKKRKNKKIKYLIIFIILSIISILINLINNKLIKNNYLNIFEFIIIPIYLIYLLIKINIEKNKIKKEKYEEKLKQQIEEEKLKNEINIIEAKIESLNNQIEQYIKEEKEQTEDIKKIQAELDAKIDNEIENIRREFSHQINVDEIIDNLDLNNIESYASYTQEELNKSKIELHSISLEENEILPKLENMITLQAEYANLQEELKDLNEQSEAIAKTKEYLSIAYEKMKSSITPKFTQNLSKNIADISNQKYTKVTLNDENGLIVENSYGEYIPVDRLSVGTIDQLYLSLRLSMLEDIADENMPIILDEAFAYYDEMRLENILRFLIEKSQNHQVIIFTCTKREQNILEKLQVPYNLVELS